MRRLALLSTMLLLGMTCIADAPLASTVDFSSVQTALISSPAGQNFPYAATVSQPTGIVNVRLVSGTVTSISPGGGGPDAYGIYVQQNAGMQPPLLRFTFDQPRAFVISSNETLTGLETNTFSYPTTGKPWGVLSVVLATATNTGSVVSFVGERTSAPYGDFKIIGGSDAFDFLTTNAPGFPYYGSAISVNVLDFSTDAQRSSWARLKKLFR